MQRLPAASPMRVKGSSDISDTEGKGPLRAFARVRQMNIPQVGQHSVFLNNPAGEILPGVSRDARAAGGVDEINVDIALPGKEDAQGYDRSGNLMGAEKASHGESSLGTEDKRADRGEDLSREELQEVRELRARDRKVRAHEQAHLAAGGGLVRGGARYEYQRGPDGKSYAVGGEVSIDTSGEKTPEQTVQKMQRVQAAALAPADPSGQDRAVAAAAARRAQAARAEMAEQAREPISQTSSAKDQAVEDADSNRQAQSHAGYRKASAPEESGKTFHVVI